MNVNTAQSQTTFSEVDLLQDVAAGRLKELLAILDAIDEGELLSEVPSNLSARARHATGVCLLSVMYRELQKLIADVEALA